MGAFSGARPALAARPKDRGPLSRHGIVGMVEEIEPNDLALLMAAGDRNIIVVDVREDHERATVCIEESIHIPMNEIPERLHEIPTDRRVIVYCHHGGRSQMVAAYLETQGYPSVLNLSGGIDLWALTVDRKLRRY